MNKILLIVKREYLTRVRKKSFLYVTFLVPILFVGMIAFSTYLAVNQGLMSEAKKVQVVDESGWFKGKLKDSKKITYTYASDIAKAKADYAKSDNDYLLHIPANITHVRLYGEKTPSTVTSIAIENALTDVARDHRLSESHIDTAILAAAEKEVSVESLQIDEQGERNANVWTRYAIGMLCAVLIYMSLFLYGAQVMRGVIEEKVSRIIEVIISSVKPFQLMMGKILGVGMVGLTQFLLWILLTVGLGTFGGQVLMSRVSPAQTEVISGGNTAEMASQKAKAQDKGEMGDFVSSLGSLNAPLIVGCFLFYFFFGYMLYSALFAAVGSAVDNETETQQFMMPVTLPLIFTFFISQSVIINNPDSNLAIWLSMIPFTSPIAMMIRIPFGVDAWQIALSMLLLVGGFLFTTWVAARIYRVGILMYGKKATYKELAKWFTYKE